MFVEHISKNKLITLCLCMLGCIGVYIWANELEIGQENCMVSCVENIVKSCVENLAVGRA